MLINVHNQVIIKLTRKFALIFATATIDTTATMPRSKARRTPVANKPTSQTIQNQVELDKDTPLPLPPLLATSSASAIEASEQPPLENDTPESTIPSSAEQMESQLAEKGKAEVLSWSIQMVESLVETLEEVFIRGGSADNSFKKSTFELAASNVRRYYTGTVVINGDKCKNKWADLKAK